VLVMPTDDPWTTSLCELEDKRALAKGRLFCDVAFQVAVRRGQQDLGALARAGPFLSRYSRPMFPSSTCMPRPRTCTRPLLPCIPPEGWLQSRPAISPSWKPGLPALLPDAAAPQISSGVARP
jgi:hypothetical protein